MYNIIGICLCFHGWGMKYHRDVDIDPAERKLVGNENLQEGDFNGADDCDGLNRTTLTFASSIIEYHDDHSDPLLSAVKSLLKHYCPMMLAASAKAPFLKQQKMAHDLEETSSNDKYNGHITVALIPVRQVFKKHPANVPQFRNIENILRVINGYENRPHLEVMFLECTGPQEPLFKPKIQLLGMEHGEQCMHNIRDIADILTDNQLFEKMIIPTVQLNNTLNGESPNNFLRYFAVGIWSRFTEPIEDISNVEMRPFVLKRENDEMVPGLQWMILLLEMFIGFLLSK
jgi:hypothetical protein